MSHDTLQTHYALKDLLRRVAFAAIVVNASLSLCGQMAEISNALAQARVPRRRGHGRRESTASLQTPDRRRAHRRRDLPDPARSRLRHRRRRAWSSSTSLRTGDPRDPHLRRTAALALPSCFRRPRGSRIFGGVRPRRSSGSRSARRSCSPPPSASSSPAPAPQTSGFTVTGSVVNLLLCLCLLFVLVKIPFWAQQLAFGRGSSTARLAKAYVATRALKAVF